MEAEGGAASRESCSVTSSTEHRMSLINLVLLASQSSVFLLLARRWDKVTCRGPCQPLPPRRSVCTGQQAGRHQRGGQEQVLSHLQHDLFLSGRGDISLLGQDSCQEHEAAVPQSGRYGWLQRLWPVPRGSSSSGEAERFAGPRV